MRFCSNNPNLSREEAEELLLSPGKKSLDIETVSVDYPLPLGIGIGVSEDTGFYFFNVCDPLILRALEGASYVIGHNLKFDLVLVERLGIKVKAYEDTKMIAYSAGILDNTLEDLSLSILHKECPSVTSLWRKPDQGNIAIDHKELARICMIHACNTWALENKLPKTQLYHDIDKPCISLLMEMEKWGILIDQYKLTQVEQFVIDKTTPMEKELKEELGVENLMSNPQVAEALRTKGIVGTRKTKGDKDSVSEESLKPLNLPVTNKLLRWRSWMKTLTTYVPAFRKVDSKGRLHTKFGYTNTGRFSSSEPNHQNITRDEKFESEEE